MALAAPPANNNNSKRVKVYELKNNDWYDRGTGFCSGTQQDSRPSPPETVDAQIIVVSEDDPSRMLLETPITKDDGFQKQQETLIVWTESSGVDMALSFQEAEGCAAIWEFVSEVQLRLAALAPDDNLSDDLLDPGHPIHLPDPQLGRLEEIEGAIRAAQTTPAGRDALIKFVMSPEHMYILKLTPLVEAAEHLQSLGDLHKLCMIMKHLILLNDTSIIEFVVTDQAIMGVVGALEYDPDFPSHRANHRQYLSDSSKFKEVVKIESPDVRRKIHYTYRLLYLKDVVLARFLDDPTFSVLNSLIFFHQVDIVNYLQTNQDFLRDLFVIFHPVADSPKKKEAVLFLQNCCAISKSIQAQNRAQLYHNFIQHGLFDIIVFSLKHHDAALRVAGTDILVALIDHDPHMVRNHIFSAIKDKAKPLTDTLIELLLIEVDLGVKSQMADAIKILLDPSTSQSQLEMMSRTQNGDYAAKQRGPHPVAPQTEAFISSFYEDSAKKLFQPLKDLEFRESLEDMGMQEASLFTHLVEILSFFVRSHSYRSKLFIINEDIHARVAQLLTCPHKYMKLTALKWFRTVIGLVDEFHTRVIMQHALYDPIVELFLQTSPRDNILNSACLDFFEFTKKDPLRPLLKAILDRHEDRLSAMSFVPTFREMRIKYEEDDPIIRPQEATSVVNEGMSSRTINGQRYTGLKEDVDEEAYFNSQDDVDGDEDEEIALPTGKPLTNGATPARPLVNYPDDEDDAMDLLASSPDAAKEKKSSSSNGSEPITSDSFQDGVNDSSPPSEPERGRDRRPVPVVGSPGRHSPPESLAVKRRRDEEDEDELGKMMGGQVKRRNSSASVGSRMQKTSLKDNETAYAKNGGHPPHHHHNQHQPEAEVNGTPPGQTLRRTKSMKTRNEGPIGAKLAIKPVNTSQAVRSDDAEVDGDGGGGGAGGGGGR